MNKVDVEKIKNKYPQGTVIRLNQMNDTYAPPSGTIGVVKCVDDMGTIHIKWENGSSLGLIYGEDKFEVIVSEK